MFMMRKFDHHLRKAETVDANVQLLMKWDIRLHCMNEF